MENKRVAKLSDNPKATRSWTQTAAQILFKYEPSIIIPGGLNVPFLNTASQYPNTRFKRKYHYLFSMKANKCTTTSHDAPWRKELPLLAGRESLHWACNTISRQSAAFLPPPTRGVVVELTQPFNCSRRIYLRRQVASTNLHLQNSLHKWKTQSQQMEGAREHVLLVWFPYFRFLLKWNSYTVTSDPRYWSLPKFAAAPMLVPPRDGELVWKVSEHTWARLTSKGVGRGRNGLNSELDEVSSNVNWLMKMNKDT